MVEEENGITWISEKGELTCFPVNIILKEITMSKQLNLLELQKNIPKKREIIFTFLNKKNDPVGFLAMKIQQQKPKDSPIRTIWPRKK